MKIVISRNLFPNEYHAVAAARVNGEWLILDNRSLTLVRDTDMIKATPQFLIDENGVHRFVPSNYSVPSPNAEPVDVCCPTLPAGLISTAGGEPAARYIGNGTVSIRAVFA